MTKKKVCTFILAVLVGCSSTMFALSNNVYAAKIQYNQNMGKHVESEKNEQRTTLDKFSILGDVKPISFNEVFVDYQNGSDTSGDGTLNNPIKTLEKAYDIVADQGIITLKGDVLLSSCIRVLKRITIRSEGSNKYSITRADAFKTDSDVNRSWYNPAMIEIAGKGNVALHLENIKLDDANKSVGTEYRRQAMGWLGEDTSKNLQRVHDSIIAIYNPDANISLENTDLLNFAGLTAIHHAGGTLNYRSGLISGGADQPLSIAIKTFSTSETTIGAGVVLKNLNGGVGIFAEQALTFGGQILNTKTEHALQLSEKANVTLTSTSKINGNTSSFAGVIYARGVDVKLTIDGEISNNKTLRDNSGALYVYESSVVIEENAKIMNNESSDPSKLPVADRGGKTAGAGIFATENANVTMNGGIISGNNSIGAFHEAANLSSYIGGGGIAVVRNSSFIMNGGKIVNNNSNSYGGGIMLHVDRANYTKGKVILNGGEISGNTAPNSKRGKDVYISGFNLNQYFATTLGNYINVNKQMIIGDGIANERTQLYALDSIGFGHILKETDKKLKDFALAQGYEAVDSTWIKAEGSNSKITFGMKAPQYDPKINDLYVAFIPVDKLTGETIGNDIKVQRQKTIKNDVVHISMDIASKSGERKYGVLLMKGPHVNVAPVINATDKVVRLGGFFDALADVHVTDEEDGSITLTKANIISNNVNTSQVGTYQVTYKVTDTHGASSQKTIEVKVLEKEIVKKTLTNATYVKGTNVPVTMISTGLYNNFKGLMMDGTIVESKNYSVKSGSTIVTYSTEFLESLEIGEHKIVFMYDDGNVEGSLRVVHPTTTTTKSNDTPQTGDISNIGLFGSTFVGSTGLLAFLYDKHYKKKSKK